MAASEQPVEQPTSSERSRALHWQSTVILAAVFAPVALWIVLAAPGPQGSLPFAFAVAVCCALALTAWTLRAVTPMAAVAGGVLALSLSMSTPSSTPATAGWWRSPLIPLLALFVLTHFATRFRREQKEKAGIAEARHGRRASQVAANAGVAALILPATAAHALLPSILPCLFCGVAALPAMVAALAEAAADTVSSEVGQASIGQASSGQPRMITTGQRVPPGTDGAISAAGTLAGVAAAGTVVLVTISVLPLPPLRAATALAGAIFGLFFDSLLGATLERWGWLNNDAVNFLSTLAAAVMAGLLATRLAR